MEAEADGSRLQPGTPPVEMSARHRMTAYRAIRAAWASPAMTEVLVRRRARRGGHFLKSRVLGELRVLSSRDAGSWVTEIKPRAEAADET